MLFDGKDDRETEESRKPRVGLQFYHARVLDSRTMGPNPQPQLYQVTRIAQGVVYYRPVDGEPASQKLVGCSEYTQIERFAKIVKSIPQAEHEK